MVSICEIGSMARSQSDMLSDKDLLAIGNPPELDAATAGYKSRGWNVARYSRLQFHEMARSHSLFVQHVKQDGRLVRDDQGFLRTTLKSYRPRNNYTEQLAVAIEPIRSIGELEPSYWGKLFQADILYVAVRNACILHRATVADPEFDFRSLIAWVSRTLGLNPSESNALLRLRPLKHAYRARSTNMDISDLSEAVDAAYKLADHWARLCGSSVGAHHFTNGYFEVRVLEGHLVRAFGPIYMDKLADGHELGELWATICNTDPYKPRPPHLQRWSKGVSEFLAREQGY